MVEKGTNSCNKKLLVSQWGGSAPDPRRGLRPLRPWTRSFPPYVLSFPLYTRPSRASHLRAYTRCVELYAQNCIKKRMQLGRTSLRTRVIGAHSSPTLAARA